MKGAGFPVFKLLDGDSAAMVGWGWWDSGFQRLFFNPAGAVSSHFLEIKMLLISVGIRYRLHKAIREEGVRDSTGSKMKNGMLPGNGADPLTVWV